MLGSARDIGIAGSMEYVTSLLLLRRIIRGLPAVLQCKYQKQNNHETSKQIQENGAKVVKTQPNNSHLVLGLILIGLCLLVFVFFLKRIHKFCSIPASSPFHSQCPKIVIKSYSQCTESHFSRKKKYM